MSADEGFEAKVSVKWFNVTKGFGFVAPEDGGGDAFLHISVLNRAGLQQIEDGTQMKCMVAPGAKGRQVTRIIELLGPGPVESRGGRDGHGFGGGRDARRDSGQNSGFERAPYAPPSAPTGDEVEVTGTVKWFKPDKGFGFVAADDGDKDIFVHKNLLRTANIMDLESGQRVKVRAQAAARGREATWITLLTE